MTIIYDINATDKTLLNYDGREAPIDPMRKTPRIPVGSTDKQPPQVEANQAARWTGDDWGVVPDYRGHVYYLADGSRHTIDTVGEELPPEALDEAPVIPPTGEEQAKAANAECTRRINSRWNQIGQINASLGVYGELDTANCAAWISSNRAALIALLAREDLIEIDVTSDEHWPVFEGSN